MADEKQGQQSGKPNKFNEQNKGAEDRKAADKRENEPTTGDPKIEPTTEATPQADGDTQNK
ncbi:MAG TPA: hypothetical protein VGC44_01135 [Longimicrobiales bacterium]